jgi:L-rhamnose mutarotase
MANGDPLTRIGTVVGIRPEMVDTYRNLHANPWPEVVAENTRAGRSNYSIFLLPQRNLLFSYYEYRGHDRAADAARMATNPVIQEWWALCRPCQVPLVEGQGDRRWADMERIFHQD